MPSPPFLQRLKNRKLVQWALAYLAGAFVVFQAVEVLAEPWRISPGLQRAIHVVLLVGLLLTLVLAWYHGEKGQQRVSGAELLSVFAVLLIGGVTLSLLPAWERPDVRETGVFIPRPGEGDPRPSVAALPFANLSSDPLDAFLADGIHEEVITQLQKIGGLRPISRTSVMGYREPAQNVRQIASDLGVGAILEGTVQKILDRLHVTVQLIDPTADEQLWAETFDRLISMDNLLDIQTEIARQIASALQLELAPEEQAQLATRPTENLEAYQAYLRGRYFQNLPHYTEEDAGRAMAEFTRAVELDSTFALAWMELANAHAQEVYFWTDASKERRETARAAADRALAAGSPSPEVHLGLGLFYLWLERDPERALAEIALAEAGLPNKQAVYEARASVYELQGRFHEAIQELRKALNVSPLDPSVYTYLSEYSWLTRQYDEAEAFADEAIALGSDQFWTNMMKVVIVWSIRGPTPVTRGILEALPLEMDWVEWGRYWQRMLEDRYEEALIVLEERDSDWIRTKIAGRPRTLLEGWAYQAMGEVEAARERFAAARLELEQEVRVYPDDPRYHSSLGLAYAGLGMNDVALREGEKGAELLPVSEDAMYGLPYLIDLACIHLMVGNEDEALRRVEELLTIPSWVSPVWMGVDFRFDSLRDNPRFQALLEAYGGS
jgi:TolB-like protein/Flp pilus assembly protein TadD